eukprot:gene45464-56633_t
MAEGDVEKASRAVFPHVVRIVMAALPGRPQIGGVDAVLGEQALDRLIMAREQEMLATYAERLQGARSLQARLQRLAELRAEEGYLARVEKDGKAWLLIEDHCPICAAASACQGFCRSELSLFTQLLGEGVRVERSEHLLEGARRCAYRISPA